jgi:hypothetical protein
VESGRTPGYERRQCWCVAEKMVRIVNGEIIQDDDPRLRPAAGTGASGSRGAASRRVRDLFTSDNERSPASVPITPNNPSYSQRTNNSTPSQETQNPLDLLAKYLKIDDRLITIPAVPPVGLTESKIGLIYLLALGLLCLIFGLRALFFGIFAYVFYKWSEKR